MKMKANKMVIMGRFHSYLEDKNVLIISLPEDDTALIPIALWGKELNENIKLLSYGDLVGVTAYFVKGRGKFCKVQAEKVTFMQGSNAGKEAK